MSALTFVRGAIPRRIETKAGQILRTRKAAGEPHVIDELGYGARPVSYEDVVPKHFAIARSPFGFEGWAVDFFETLDRFDTGSLRCRTEAGHARCKRGIRALLIGMPERPVENDQAGISTAQSFETAKLGVLDQIDRNATGCRCH